MRKIDKDVMLEDLDEMKQEAVITRRGNIIRIPHGSRVYSFVPEGHRAPIKYYINSNGCHICVSQMPKINTYPKLYKDGRVRSMHRVLYEYEYGYIPSNIAVMHSCDNKLCINLEHLSEGTWSKNIKDAHLRGLKAPARGVDHAEAKLTPKQVMEIRNSPDNCTKIAEKFGLSRGYAWKVKNKWTWKHLDDC
jgi:hypothetical protein